MFPTLHEQDRVLALRYWPKRWLKKGQIIIIQSKGQSDEWPLTADKGPNPIAQKTTRYIKRLIALEGETYRTTQAGNMHGNRELKREWTIPPGHCFACGDNLDASFDSRQFGPVPFEKIWGVMLLHWTSRRVTAHPSLEFDLESLPGILPGRSAPPFSANTLQGQSISLETFAGRTFALIFIENSDTSLGALGAYTKHNDALKDAGVELVIVSLLPEDETRTLTENLPTTTTPVLIAPEYTNSIKKDYRVDSTPFFFVINAQGKVQASGYASTNYRDLLHGME
jgi:signal peptidase I